jgi:hypothetical protein
MSPFAKSRWLWAVALAVTAVGGLAQEPHGKGRAMAPVKHVLWVTKGQWVYGDTRSGATEAAAVRVAAAPSDVVEFRQSHGRHRVFFYITDPKSSELGQSIRVAEDFEVVQGPKRLERLPVRLFRRANLSTPEPAEGRSTLLTIKLKPSFRRPLYFGSFEPGPGGGTTPFFGVIYPVKARAAHARKPATADFRFADARRVGRPNRADWVRGLLGQFAPSQPPTWQFIRGKRLIALPTDKSDGKGIDLTAQWFHSPEVSDYSPARSMWSFGTVARLDPEAAPSVIALIAPAGRKSQWVALLSNAVQDGKRMVAQAKDERDAMAFVRAVAIAPGPEAARTNLAFAVAADLNNDGRPDLILYDGGTLRVAMNFPVPRKRPEDPPTFRFTLGAPIVPKDKVALEGVYLVFPLDADFDGWTDLLVAARGGNAMIFFNRAPGVISGQEMMVLPNTAFNIQEVGLEDLDGDGRSDLVLRGAEGVIRTFFNNGDRQFAAK